MTEREVESREPSVCGYCGNGDIESDGVHTCVNSVPDQARAEGRAEALAEVVARPETDEAFAPNESLRQRAIAAVREMGEK